MPLSWKLLQDMKMKSIGVNEVEAEAWRREANREAKKGKERPDKKERWKRKRNKEYIRKQMELRVGQAKEDWEEDGKEDEKK